MHVSIGVHLLVTSYERKRKKKQNKNNQMNLMFSCEIITWLSIWLILPLPEQNVIIVNGKK